MTGSRLCWCLLRVLLLAGVEWPSLLLPWLRLWGQAEPLPSSSTQLPSPLPQGPAYSLIHFAFGWNVGEHIVFYGDSCPLCRFLMTLMLTLKSWASGKVKTMFRTRRDDHPNNRVEGHHLHLFSAGSLLCWLESSEPNIWPTTGEWKEQCNMYLMCHLIPEFTFFSYPLFPT